MRQSLSNRQLYFTGLKRVDEPNLSQFFKLSLDTAMISLDQLQQIAATIRAQTLNEQLINDLRRDYAGIHFTYCMDDDIPNHQATLEESGFNVYLIDGREHCLCLTRELEHASGIVIAEIIAD